MTSKDSEQPVHPPSIARDLIHPSLDSLEAVDHAISKDSDQTARMCRLIRVFAGHTSLIVGFVAGSAFSFSFQNKVVLLMLSLGQYTTVLLMLIELKQFDKAGLFLQACLKHKLLEKNSQTGKLLHLCTFPGLHLKLDAPFKSSKIFRCAMPSSICEQQITLAMLMN